MKIVKTTEAILPDVTTLTDEALWCRTERHPWAWERDSMAETGVEFDRIATCPLCGAVRTKTISLVSFTSTKHKIHYPAGFLVHGGRLSQSQVYKEQLGRMAAKASRRKKA